MFKRLMAVMMLAAGLALVGGPAAHAAPGKYVSCTFEKGLTTCTTFYHYVSNGPESTGCVFTHADGYTQPGYQTVIREITFSVSEVYRGRNTDKDPMSVSVGPTVNTLLYASPCRLSYLDT